MTITIKTKDMHHDFLIGDDEDDYLRELAWLDAQDEMEYKMWLEEENKRIEPITKIEIRHEQVQDKDSHLQER